MNIFAAAAEAMSTRGKCARQLEDGNGRVCLNGAINIAKHGGSAFAFLDERYRVTDTTKEIFFLDQLAREMFPAEWAKVGGWVDPSARIADLNNRFLSEQECISLLEKAAIRWDEEKLLTEHQTQPKGTT